MTGTAVALVGQDDGSAKLIRGIFAGGGLSLQTSMPMETVEQKKKVLRLVQQSGENIGKYIGKKITIHDVIAHPAEFVNKETGEVTYGARIIMVCAGGKTVTCASGGVARSLGMLVDTFGPLPWVKGLTVEVEQIATAANRRTFQLVVAD